MFVRCMAPSLCIHTHQSPCLTSLAISVSSFLIITRPASVRKLTLYTSLLLLCLCTALIRLTAPSVHIYVNCI